MVFDKISANNKRIITAISMVLLSAYSITSPIDLKGMLPEWISTPKVGTFSLINIASYLVLLGAIWVFNKETA